METSSLKSLKQNIEMKSDIIKKAPFAEILGALFALGLDHNWQQKVSAIETNFRNIVSILDQWSIELDANDRILNFLDVTGIKKGKLDPSLPGSFCNG